jgi:hypothetical protein
MVRRARARAVRSNDQDLNRRRAELQRQGRDFDREYFAETEAEVDVVVVCSSEIVIGVDEVTGVVNIEEPVIPPNPQHVNAALLLRVPKVINLD